MIACDGPLDMIAINNRKHTCGMLIDIVYDQYGYEIIPLHIWIASRQL